MSLPFYKAAEGEKPPQQMHQHANVGLWFTRFYNAFDHNWEVGDEGKRAWIQTVQGAKGDKATLEKAAARLESLGKALGAQIADFKTDWHFATGLGLSHPVENGFTWHHTLGVPYLPASSVKGLLRDWVEAWMEHASEAERDDKINRWFGAVKGEKNASSDAAGQLIFFDALPTGLVNLACDIMTPHMGKWYEKGGEIRDEADYAAAPADWHSPVPVPFLVVKSAGFRFMIAPRLIGHAEQDALASVKDAMEQLTLALEWIGAGAKTAAGYGRMSRIKTEAELAADKAAAVDRALIDAGITKAQGVIWLGAKATWDKSKQAFTVLGDGKKASLDGKTAKDLFNGLSEAGQKRLKEGKKPLTVDATVDLVGNMIALLALQEVPAA